MGSCVEVIHGFFVLFSFLRIVCGILGVVYIFHHLPTSFRFIEKEAVNRFCENVYSFFFNDLGSLILNLIIF